MEAKVHASDAVEEAETMFLSYGTTPYESGVTHTEHALQTATLAELAGAEPSEIAAALLHDIGHLSVLVDQNDITAALAKHEEIGFLWLKTRYVPEVSEPARMHVEAKRFLCFSDSTYWRSLSDDSRTSLVFQGGPFDSYEASRFLSRPYSNVALKLRRWDDNGKQPGRSTPDLRHFLDILSQCVLRHSKR